MSRTERIEHPPARPDVPRATAVSFSGDSGNIGGSHFDRQRQHPENRGQKNVSTAAPDRVVIFDTTLRDGEQSPGASMNLAEKLEMARALAGLLLLRRP